MRVPDRILQTACLLGFKKETPQYAGSGFVVAVAGARGSSHLYLVTARHLAERMECTETVIGFSYKDGHKAIFEVENLHWYAHPDEAIAVDAVVTPFGMESLHRFVPTEGGADDAVVTPLAPVQRDLLDLEPIPERLFASAERMREGSIGVSDEITAISMFTRFTWEDRHQPIVRTGNLAMLPALRVPVKNFEPMEAYVAEIEGLSGSPVWTRPTAGSHTAQEKRGGTEAAPPPNIDEDMVLLGLLHGRWEIPKQAIAGLSAQYTENMTSGMSIIVPAHKILEVINQPELAALRKKTDEEKG